MPFALSRQLKRLPPYLFAEIDRKRHKAISQGHHIISLGVGDPDQPTPSHIVEAARVALSSPSNHPYPFGAGKLLFRQSIASWYWKRFGVRVDPDQEIHVLMGSKEGLGHLPLAYLNPGDVALVPEPAYPVYARASLLAGGKVYFLPLKEERGFLPDLGKIPVSVRRRAKLLFLNYPNNPTAAMAPHSFFEEVVHWAKRHKIIVVHDAAYSEIYFEEPPISFLSISEAKDVGVEFHSCSKTYNMTGWRVGWVCGNASVIAALSQVKDTYDSGVFGTLQDAAQVALEGPQVCTEEARKIYRERRHLLIKGLEELGWHVAPCQATFYVWARPPHGAPKKSIQVATHLLEKAHVVVTPGVGFGPSGEGYIRFALTVGKEELSEALQRLRQVIW